MKKRQKSIFLSLILCAASISYAAELKSATSYENSEGTEKRLYTDYELLIGSGEKVHFTVSTPKEVPKKGLPCIIVIAGLETGRKSLNLIPEQGNFAILAYEYAPIIKDAKKADAYLHPLALRKALLSIPQELTEISAWTQEENWSNRKPPAIMGVSFGAMFVPAAYHIAEENDQKLGPCILAFGGADLYELLKTNLPYHPVIKVPVAFLIAQALSPLEPKKHLPYIKEDLLIITATQDKQIPYEKSSKPLQEISPEPKTVVEIDEDHLHPSDKKMMLKLITITKNWLKKTSWYEK